MTGSYTCAVCNRELKNPESVRMGIGPICRARLEREALAREIDPETTDNMLSLTLFPLDESVVLIRDERGISTNVPRIVTRHSPTGYEWGYGGSGPADLALNICEYYVRVLRNEGVEIGKAHKLHSGFAHDMTLKVYQQFKAEFIAGAPIEGGSLNANYIMSWLKARIPEQKQLI